jgi:DNA (cytosine-5)-methyltransferase 1
MNNLGQKMSNAKTTHNKGEWSELLAFVKFLAEQQVFLADSELNSTANFLNIHKVTTENLDLEFLILDKSTIEIVHKKTGLKKQLNISDLINTETLNALTEAIKSKSGTFELPEFEIIQDALGFSVVKGGNSNQKADILLDISNNDFSQRKNEGFGIKSYLGAKPTLLNASGNTNFIFRIDGLSADKIDEINAIDSSTKLRDRIIAIEQHGGSFHYVNAEKEAMTHNLKMVDSLMPEIISHILLAFYKNRIRFK